MARKGLKREATQINGEGPSSSTVAHDRGHKPVGSGHTLVGSDTTIQGDVDPIGMCDESNQGAAKNGKRFPMFDNERWLTTFI